MAAGCTCSVNGIAVLEMLLRLHRYEWNEKVWYGAARNVKLFLSVTGTFHDWCTVPVLFVRLFWNDLRPLATVWSFPRSSSLNLASSDFLSAISRGVKPTKINDDKHSMQGRRRDKRGRPEDTSSPDSFFLCLNIDRNNLEVQSRGHWIYLPALDQHWFEIKLFFINTVRYQYSYSFLYLMRLSNEHQHTGNG